MHETIEADIGIDKAKGFLGNQTEPIWGRKKPSLMP